MLFLALIPVAISAQESNRWDALLLVDSRIGYSTNTLLIPFQNEWDRTSGSGYGLLSPVARVERFGSSAVLSLSGGALFEPFLGDRTSLLGGFGIIDYRYRIGSGLSAGVETGGSRLSAATNQDLLWVQPVLYWSPTPFTQVRARAGSTIHHRKGNVSEGEEDTTTRFDLFGVEIETWPRLNWQVRGGIFGNLSRPLQSPGFRFHIDHLPNPDLRAGLRFSLDSYRVSLSEEGGFGLPGGGNGTVIETDRILRAGVSLQYRLNRLMTVTLSADRLALFSHQEDVIHDSQLSAGLRFLIRPRLNGGNRAEAEWEQNNGQSVTIRLRYTGEGALYITGSFNGWEHPGVPLLRQSSGRYAVQLDLEQGVYEYKVLLAEGDEEEWIEFGDQTYTVSDGFGGTNGLIFIE